jgi:hypothetical protein
MLSINEFLEHGYLLFITSLFTTISCSLIASVYIVNKDRSYGFSLIVILCVSNLALTMIIIIDILKYNITEIPIESGIYCTLTGALKMMFLDGAYLSIVMISYSLYKSIVL